jgi:hypothetical protein
MLAPLAPLYFQEGDHTSKLLLAISRFRLPVFVLSVALLVGLAD